MKRPYCFVLFLPLLLPAHSQPLTRQNVANILGFENNSTAGAFPAGWTGSADAIFTDGQVVHTGKYAARIERTASSSGTFSTLTQSIPVDFSGKTIEWRGFLQTENVANYVALWMREDSASGTNVGFATLQGLNVGGTAGWKQYSISLPWQADARQLFFGFLLNGPGKAWVDDLQLFVDGQPVAQAPSRSLTVLDTDHQFDNGSGIALASLSDSQIANLAILAKVWGFLKYHHPAVTSGAHHWDYDLFRILPQVLAASGSSEVNGVLSAWVASLAEVAACTNCATLQTSDLALDTNLQWLSDQSLLGPALSQTLLAVYRNRVAASSQFFVSLTPNAGNPSFDHELSYPSIHFPDAGYQILALFRFWNMVQYFYPNREIMSDDPARQSGYWNQVLIDSIPSIALAPDSTSYQRELMRFIGKIHDTHANLWSSLSVRPPVGTCYLPVDVRFVEGSAVILRHTSAAAGPASGLLPGDIIQQLDGLAVADLVSSWTPWYADSNQAARLRDMGEYLTRGPCGPASVVVQRGLQTLALTPARLPVADLDFSATHVHDRPGPVFQLLSSDVAYLKLSSVVAADSATYIRAAAGTKGLIIDIRNYPSEFVVFTLGDLLASAPVNFVQFTRGDIGNPGAFHWADVLGLTPQQPHYAGKVVVLVDEITQSQAEYTTMAFRAAGAMVIGSTTAGADGNVSTVPLPGSLSSYISGIGVFYPNHVPTQRVGIVPDLFVAPTIAGIQAGRDELLDAAIRQITNPGPLHRHRPHPR